MQLQNLQNSVKALKKHESISDNKDQLFQEQNQIYVQLVSKKIGTGLKPHPKPVTLKHPLELQGTVGHCCIFVKDPQADYKHKLLNIQDKDGNKVISKVISIGKLKMKYSTFEARRLLADSYACFLADERVVSLLPGLLGKKFIAKKKLPLGVKVDTVLKLKSEEAYDMLYQKAHLTTPYYIPNSKEKTGALSSLRVGHVDMSEESLVENIEHVVPQMVAYNVGGLENVEAVYLKTSTSIALPLYKAEDDGEEADQQLAKKVKDLSDKRKLNILDQEIEGTGEVAEVRQENRAAIRQLMKKIKVQL